MPRQKPTDEVPNPFAHPIRLLRAIVATNTSQIAKQKDFQKTNPTLYALKREQITVFAPFADLLESGNVVIAPVETPEPAPTE